LIAGAIHFNSRRRKNSFIAVNCAALPETLLESELFGHEKGAFTGAHKNRIGRCEQADKGTLFLDEISEMAPMTQAKILRFLQNQELVRVGGTDTIKVDVQIIAATNKDLQHEVKEGRFREDLYYRLNVVHIPLPPLRERKEDIPLLAEFFLDRYRRTLNKKEISGFDDKAIKLLMEHDWPGNIRELENVVERAVLMGEDKVIHAEDILYIESQQGMSMGLHKDISLPPEGITLDEVEKNLILQALERTGWIQKDAAKLLGLSRRVIQYKIAKHNIKNPKWPKNR
jgi:transcriptional regulator with GAF, ATPase, and Fis domain